MIRCFLVLPFPCYVSLAGFLFSFSLTCSVPSRSLPQNEIRSKLSLLHAPQNETDRRSIIKAELDALQATQRDAKTDRTKLFDTLKRTQESIAQKSKDVNAQRAKLPVKSAADAETRIAQLDRQIESGTLKLIDEKKALAEISALRRAMGALAKVGALEEAIAADRERVEEVRRQLDDPESKKVQARWDELKREMDGLREEGKKAWDERNALFERRNELQKQMVSTRMWGLGRVLNASQDDLYTKKKDLNQKHRDAQDA